MQTIKTNDGRVLTQRQRGELGGACVRAVQAGMPAHDYDVQFRRGRELMGLLLAGKTDSEILQWLQGIGLEPERAQAILDRIRSELLIQGLDARDLSPGVTDENAANITDTTTHGTPQHDSTAATRAPRSDLAQRVAAILARQRRAAGEPAERVIDCSAYAGRNKTEKLLSWCRRNVVGFAQLSYDAQHQRAAQISRSVEVRA